MNLCLDIGNTRTKAAIFDGKNLVSNAILTSESGLTAILDRYQIDRIGITSVVGSHPYSEILSRFKPLLVDSATPLPIRLLYETPETLGADRICAAMGGFGKFPDSNVLTIDIGTCIKYEVINRKGEYLGGNISPGMHMRFKSLNTQTAALPLIEPSKRVNDIGLTTEQAIRNGVQLGILCELEAMIDRMNALLPNLNVVLTGGDFHHFENDLKTPIFAHPLLVLEGLNEILLFNHQN